MYRIIARYIASCTPCQRRKNTPGSGSAPLQQFEPPSELFERVGVDMLGPFPSTPAGSRWVIVAVDHPTRYVETKALQNGSAAEVAKFFVSHILLSHGAPRVVVSDRGTRFVSALVTNVCSCAPPYIGNQQPSTRKRMAWLSGSTVHWRTCSLCMFPAIIENGTSFFHLQHLLTIPKSSRPQVSPLSTFFTAETLWHLLVPFCHIFQMVIWMITQHRYCLMPKPLVS